MKTVFVKQILSPEEYCAFMIVYVILLPVFETENSLDNVNVYIHFKGKFGACPKFSRMNTYTFQCERNFLRRNDNC